MERFFNNVYGPMILHPVIKVLVGVAYLVYIAGAVYGVANMKQGLQFDRLLLADDPTVHHINKQAKYMQQGVQVCNSFYDCMIFV